MVISSARVNQRRAIERSVCLADPAGVSRGPPRSECCAAGEQSAIGERSESFSQLRRRVYNKRLQRDHRRGARLDRGIACDLQLAHHLDHAIRSLRGRRRLPGQPGPGSDLGIDGVGLARRAARAPVTPIHLYNTMPCAAHRPCKAGTIAAGAFDAERLDPPMRGLPT